MYDLATQARFDYLRRKALQGTSTPEEMRESVQLLAQGRKSAAIASTSARTTRAKASAPIPSGDDLLDEMMNS